MAEKLKIKISNAEKELLNSDAEYLVLPAKGGEIGIYPGHMRLFTELLPGFIKININGKSKDFEIFGGFAKIKNDVIEIFS